MARPSTPTSVLELRGAFKKNPQRARKNEPVPTAEVGEAPVHLDDGQGDVWRELVAMIPPRVLGNCDRWAVELAAVLMCKQRREGLSVGELSQLIALMGRMGMTPSDRAKIHVPPEKPKSEWEKLRTQ